jgi:hypothetical protein
MHTLSHEAEAVNPDSIVFQQDITFLPAIPAEGDVPADVEPTGPTAADEAWWAENAPRPDDWSDDDVVELGPDEEMSDADWDRLCEERWGTTTPSGYPDSFDMSPGGVD